jgi:hypothetical protein
VAVTHIAFNDQLQHGRLLRRCLNGLEDGYENLLDVIDVMAQMLDGDGSAVGHFAYHVSKFGFADTTAAKACWDELQSLKGKLSVNSSVTDVNAALLQAFAKLR